MLKNKKYLYGARNVLIPSRINFGEFMLQKLWFYKNNVALTNAATNETLKHGEIAQQAMNLAISLHRLGVRKGDMVAIISENRMEYFGTIIGVACVGAALTLINPLYRKDELIHATNISKPKYVICSKLVHDAHISSLQSVESIEKIIIYGTDKEGDCISYNDLVIAEDDENYEKSGNDVERLKSDVNYDDFEVADVLGQTDTLFLLYSSGTTGLSKGVQLTHFNAISLICSEPFEYIEGPILNIGPWFHVMALLGSLLFFCAGKEVVFLPKFEINLYLNTIQTHKVTMLFVAPAILVTILKCEKQYDLSSVRRIVSGSAPLYVDVIKNVTSRFPNLEGIVTGYGLTETTLAIVIGRFDNPKSVNSASAGKVVPNTTIKIVGANKELLGPYERGEICTKGDLNMKGYVGGDTAAMYDDDGFMKTGDIGYYDEDGLLYVVDRLKELIKYKGNQVPPAELEALLLQHEAVKDAGVVGVPDEAAGELPVAFVALRPGMSATEKEILDFVAERISKTKHLRGGVRFIAEIPKNSAGKILRHTLKNLAITGDSRN